MGSLSTRVVSGWHVFLEEPKCEKGECRVSSFLRMGLGVTLPKWCFLMGQPVSVGDLSTTSNRKSTLMGFTNKGKTLAHQSAKLRSRFRHQVQLDQGSQDVSSICSSAWLLLSAVFVLSKASPGVAGWPWDLLRLPSPPEGNSAYLHPNIPGRSPEIRCHWPVLGPLLMGCYGFGSAPGMCSKWLL